MSFSEKTLCKKTIFEGKVFDVECHTVRLDNEKDAYREVVVHNGGAAIIAFDDEDKIFLVKQFRKGAEREMLEIPAGKLEAGENPMDCAVRELGEEIGADAKQVRLLSEFFVTPAYCSEKISVYMAQGLCYHSQKLDEDELLEIVKVPFKKAYEMVISGEIIDAKTIIAILKAKEIRNL